MSHDSLHPLSRRVLLTLILAVGAAGGCGESCCVETVAPIPQPEVCALDTACEGGKVFRYGACDFGGCEADADCCPGTRCRVDINTCFPVLLDAELACETNADCPDQAQGCQRVAVGARDPLPVCVFDKCAGDNECGFGRACFHGRCITNAPCGGNCPEGSVCDVATNSCHQLPIDREGSVADSCKGACAGILVVKDDSSMSGEVCCATECECKTVPPLVPTRFGRYARVAVSSREALVSAYDAEYGDLVVARFALDGTFNRLDYVDGVPSSEPPTADPAGPRGGIRAPGPDVGKHTSIAVDNQGLSRIAYQDADGRSLKVAIEGPTGFTSHFVDGDDAGSVGQFTDIAVAADGTILVSYLAHNASIPGIATAATAVKLARSRTPTPTSAADWEILPVDARPMIDATGLREESVEMPRGRGLHSSIVLDGDDVLIASYDAVDGDVRLARVSGSTITTVIVDGDGVGRHRTGDVGRFPTIGILGTDLLVVYEDFTRHDLRFWRGPKATPGTGGSYGTVDGGRVQGAAGKHFVGAGARVATEGTLPVLVYQDASDLDLKLGTLDGLEWSQTAVLTDGAHGFYPDLAIADGKAYVCSVLAELDGRGRERSRLRLDVQSLP